jgi:hypothetical protein
MLRSSLLAVVFLAAASAHAQVYKCIDASGKTIYLQDPCPPKTKSEAINRALHPAAAAPATAGSAEAAAKSPSDPAAKGAEVKLTPEQAFQKRQQEKAEAQKKEDEKQAKAKEKDDNCRRFRDQLAGYESGGRITRFDASGQRYFLDDAQLAQESARARAGVDQWCK